jgi:hypothetical protein
MLTVDLAIYDTNQQLVLTVETKRLSGMTDEWASQLRRNLVTHGYPRARYFLLATPDRFFLWIGEKNGAEVTEPDYVADPTGVLEVIYPEFGASSGDASSFIFEQVVTRWLKSVMYPGFSKSLKLPKWVTSSGLDKAIHQGDFQFEIAA